MLDYSCNLTHIIICAPAMLRASIVFVCVSAKNLESYWSEIDVTWWEYEPWWTLEVIGCWWHLIFIFYLESYFGIFQKLRLYLYNGLT